VDESMRAAAAVLALNDWKLDSPLDVAMGHPAPMLEGTREGRTIRFGETIMDPSIPVHVFWIGVVASEQRLLQGDAQATRLLEEFTNRLRSVCWRVVLIP
jgi:hypothetical protein